MILLQTQRQLQVSLEAHGKYISSLIEPETSSPYTGNGDDALLDTLPPLELAISQGPGAAKMPTGLGPIPFSANLSLDISRSSATCLSPFQSQPLVRPTSAGGMICFLKAGDPQSTPSGVFACQHDKDTGADFEAWELFRY